MIDVPVSMVSLVLGVVLPFLAAGFGDSFASVVLDFPFPANVD
jgi:hypothetical protein